MKGMKATTDEGGVRSVCYLRWPSRLPAGRTITRIAGAIDLLPTLTALAGIPRVGDKPLDGRDLTPLLLNPPPTGPIHALLNMGRTHQHRAPIIIASTIKGDSSIWMPIPVKCSHQHANRKSPRN